jgi:lysosomal alpha-mannosidase
VTFSDDIGKEIITRYSTGWATEGIFYTDSNGRETLQRKRDYRPTWEVEISEPVSANYYPITTHIAIKGDGSQLSVLPDRAQGGSSINDGEIELMLHRRLLKDDGYGVGEALNETAYDQGLVARGRHIVVFGSDSASSPSVTAQQRQLSQSRMVLDPLVLLSPTSLTLQEWQDNFYTEVNFFFTQVY